MLRSEFIARIKAIYAQALAEKVDLEMLREAGKLLDKQPVPLIGRYWWNPETNEVEAIK